MSKWEINITRTQEMSLIVEADTYEEALAVYEDPESNCADYEVGNGGEVRLDNIVKIEESTYNGISKAICLNCGKITQDINALEILNDSDATCTACNMHAVAWHTQGEIIVTAQVDDEEPIRYTIREGE
jgi:hypothetical protein